MHKYEIKVSFRARDDGTASKAYNLVVAVLEMFVTLAESSVTNLTKPS